MALIQLNSNLTALVDDSDYGWLSQWKWGAYHNKKTKITCVNRTEYVQGSCAKGQVRKSRWISMHREILEAPAEAIVTHVNGDVLDNRRCNLRMCSMRQRNIKRERFKGASFPFKGIWKNGNGFGVKISEGVGKRKYLGTFPTIEEAALAYDEAAKIFYGEFAGLNFA